jgi:hypothetical protein
LAQQTRLAASRQQAFQQSCCSLMPHAPSSSRPDGIIIHKISRGAAVLHNPGGIEMADFFI